MTQKIVGRFIIEIAGKPVENVEKALNLVLEKIKEEKKRFKIVESHVGEPELNEETTLYGGFLDIEIKFSEVKELLNFVMDYTPTSIEIVEPEELNLNLVEINDLLNVFSSTQLEANSKIRNLSAYIHMLKEKYEKK